MKPLSATVFRSAIENGRLANAANTLLIAALICGFLYFDGGSQQECEQDRKRNGYQHFAAKIQKAANQCGD